MSESMWFFGLPESPSSELSDPDKLYKLVNLFRQQGYSLTDGSPRPYYAPTNILQDPEQIYQKILDQYQKETVLIHEYFWTSPFEFQIDLDIGGQTAWIVNVEYRVLTRDDYALGDQNSTAFIEAIKTALEVYPCYFGFADGMPPDEMPDLPLDSSFRVKTVYPVNFYSSALIEKQFDRQYLLNAPGWKAEEVAGGVLLVPSLQAVYSGHGEENIRALASYLKLQVG
jgi:hypothetical protein